jgi:hypothetical protein
MNKLKTSEAIPENERPPSVRFHGSILPVPLCLPVRSAFSSESTGFHINAPGMGVEADDLGYFVGGRLRAVNLSEFPH